MKARLKALPHRFRLPNSGEHQYDVRTPSNIHSVAVPTYCALQQLKSPYYLTARVFFKALPTV